ncbi:MAG: C10 family peptidase [Bacteroidales bacterium]|nr:C10 family peptidase [Bacteroidales bacterium]
MKCILKIFLILFVLSSCTKQEPISQPINLNNLIVTSKSVIPVEDALRNLQTLLDGMYPSTKGNYKDLSTANVCVFGGKTMKSTSVTVPDSTLYLVNFGDDDGFAVLSAQRGFSFPVFCVTESGSLTIDDLDEALQFLEESACVQTRSADEYDSLFYGMGEEFVPRLIMSAVLSQLSMSRGGNGSDLDTAVTLPDDGGFPVRPRDSLIVPEPRNDTITKAGPFLETKWTQGSPFNDFRADGAPAGCVAIATAQILAHKEINLSGTHFNWDLLKSVYHYTDPNATPGLLARKEASYFLQFVGLPQNCNIIYDTDGSSGWADGARRTFSNCGYHNTEKRFGFQEADRGKVVEMLTQGYPVYMDGSKSLLDGAKGHAWVIDGLLVYKYIFYTATLYNLFHINWGWNGTNDGYFEQGVFDITNRHSIETGFDSGANSTQSSNYTWNYRIITYSLY